MWFDSPFWTLGNRQHIGPAKGEVEKNTEDTQTMQVADPNMTWLLKKTNA